MSLTDEQLSRFARDGYLILRGVMDPSRLRAAREAIARSLAKDDSIGNMRRYLSDTFCPDAVAHPDLLALVEPLRPAVASLFGTLDAPRIGHAQIALRFPQLHRDQPQHNIHLDGFPVARAENRVPASSIYRHTLLAGVYLTPLHGPDRGNFVAWPGSHAHFAEVLRALDPPAFLAAHTAEELHERVRRETPPGAPVQVEVEAGDALLAHHLLAHGASDNLSMQVREAIYFRVIHPEHDPRDPGALSDVTRFFAPRLFSRGR